MANKKIANKTSPEKLVELLDIKKPNKIRNDNREAAIKILIEDSLSRDVSYLADILYSGFCGFEKFSNEELETEIQYMIEMSEFEGTIDEFLKENEA